MCDRPGARGPGAAFAASLVLATLAMATSAGGSPADSLNRLGWLAGSWSGDTLGVRTEEHWMAPAAGLMVGMHRETRPGRKPWFEFLRIAADSSGIGYLANPGGRAPATRFPMVEMGDRKIVFAKPDHDFPQRIAYWLEDDGTLRARVEGIVKGKLEHQEWRWRPSRLVDR